MCHCHTCSNALMVSMAFNRILQQIITCSLNYIPTYGDNVHEMHVHTVTQVKHEHARVKYISFMPDWSIQTGHGNIYSHAFTVYVCVLYVCTSLIVFSKSSVASCATISESSLLPRIEIKINWRREREKHEYIYVPYFLE